MLTPSELIRYVSDGFEKAKAGQAADVYETVRQYHDRGLLERRSHYAFGWIIYYALHQAENYDIDGRKRMLARYLKLEVTRPHKLHSMILTEAIRLHKDAEENAYLVKSRNATAKSSETVPAFSFIKFMALWNMAHLREGDWKRKEKDGKPLNATVEKLITRYTAEIESSRQLPPQEFMDILQKARVEYPDSATLLAQIAAVHAVKGEKEEAVNTLQKAILLSPSKFFLWSRLADFVDKEKNPKLYIALLYKALSLPGQDDFKGKIRLSMADAWIGVKAYHHALWELRKAKEIYERNGWHLPHRFLELDKLIPLSTSAADPLPIYQKIAPLAEKYIYSSLPMISVRKNYHKEASVKEDRYGRSRPQPVAWRVADEKGNNYWFTPSQFKIDENLPIGSPLCVSLYNGKVVNAVIE